MKNNILVSAMIPASLACVLLLLFRVKLSGGFMFFFLGWNLFLAWIPVLLSALSGAFLFSGKKIKALSVLFAWLVFFPNSAYLITDIVHIRHVALDLLWYDILLIFSFAITGFTLALITLKEVHTLLTFMMGRYQALTAVVFISGLTGFGVYLGRIERWNSWDILFHPLAITKDILDFVVHPIGNFEVWLTTFGFMSLTLLGYWIFSKIVSS